MTGDFLQSLEDHYANQLIEQDSHVFSLQAQNEQLQMELMETRARLEECEKRLCKQDETDDYLITYDPPHLQGTDDLPGLGQDQLCEIVLGLKPLNRTQILTIEEVKHWNVVELRNEIRYRRSQLKMQEEQDRAFIEKYASAASRMEAPHNYVPQYLASFGAPFMTRVPGNFVQVQYAAAPHSVQNLPRGWVVAPDDDK